MMEYREVDFKIFFKSLPLIVRIFVSKSSAKMFFNAGYLCRLKEGNEKLSKEYNDLIEAETQQK